MQFTVWLFTIYKMSPFSCRFKGKFPGTTEHLKGPVFRDGIFQKKILKTIFDTSFRLLRPFLGKKGLILQMVNTNSLVLNFFLPFNHKPVRPCK